MFVDILADFDAKVCGLSNSLVIIDALFQTLIVSCQMRIDETNRITVAIHSN